MTAKRITVAGRISRCLFVFTALLLTGCQALVRDDLVAAIDINATGYAVEVAQLRLAASADQTSVAATVSAAGTEVASQSALNVAMGATLRAASTPTVGVRAVVVNASDMDTSLRGMMADSTAGDGEQSAMRVWDVAMARSVDSSSGCSTGLTREFSADAERIYLTARVSNLREDTYFEVDWVFQDRVLGPRPSWRSDYSAASECIWFFATPEDFPFLPGPYSGTLYVNGLSQAATEFTIAPAP